MEVSVPNLYETLVLIYQTPTGLIDNHCLDQMGLRPSGREPRHFHHGRGHLHCTTLRAQRLFVRSVGQKVGETKEKDQEN